MGKTGNRENENDKKWDRKLNIRTVGRDDSHADAYRYPYEPTPYSVLERLAESGYIHRDSVVVDYGCGQGRVSIFLSYKTGCCSTGVEYDETQFSKAVENGKSGVHADNVRFVYGKAEEYSMDANTDCFYFFNPFSVEILHKVMRRIRDSYYENPREMRLFFYYPSNEYIAYLMTVDEWEFLDEIDCRDLFGQNNERERILIFACDTYS